MLHESNPEVVLNELASEENVLVKNLYSRAAEKLTRDGNEVLTEWIKEQIAIYNCSTDIRFWGSEQMSRLIRFVEECAEMPENKKVKEGLDLGKKQIRNHLDPTLEESIYTADLIKVKDLISTYEKGYLILPKKNAVGLYSYQDLILRALEEIRVFENSTIDTLFKLSDELSAQIRTYREFFKEELAIRLTEA